MSVRRSMQFFYSGAAKNPKLHAELLCSGVSRFSMARLGYYSTGDTSLGSDLDLTPDIQWPLVGQTGMGAGCSARLERLGDGPHELAMAYKESACQLRRTGALDLEAIISHDARLCRVCALVSVFAWACDVGERSTFVTFSGQGVPEEDSGAFSWGETSETGRARLLRLANIGGLGVIPTGAGPVAYGFVSHALARLLRRNARSYVLDDRALLESVRTGHDVGWTLDTYWALRNHRPPEIHGEDHDLFAISALLSA